MISTKLLAGRHLIVEEKLDGANSAISFSEDGRLLLQSRGHFLDGGPREKHFGLMKAWAMSIQRALWERLRSRYVIYGEWMYAKHTMFYDQLPHYFFEFDVLDKEHGDFLSTAARQELLSGLPLISAPVLFSGSIKNARQLRSFITRSSFQSVRWRDTLTELCGARRLEPERTLSETDSSGLMEGLYIKVEDAHKVIERFKFVRNTFLQAVDESGDHWLNRPIIPNQLREGVDIFETTQ